MLQLNVGNQLANNYRVALGGFDGWYNGAQLISRSASASVTVNGPVNLTDKWNYLPYVPPVIVVVLVAVILFFGRRGTIPTPRLPEWKLSRPKRSKPKRSKKRVRRSKPKVETLDTEIQPAQTAEVKETKLSRTVKTIMYCTQCGR